MSTGNYAGLNGLFINPSSISNSKKYLDIQLASGSIFFDNNFIYIPREDNRIQEKMNLTRRAFILDFPGFYDDDYIFSDRYDTDPVMGYSDIRLSGPGIMYSSNGHAFALQLTNRFILSGNRVPYDISKLAYEHRHYPPFHGIRFTNENRFAIGSASWMELGLTYSRSFDYGREFKISTGINAKRLWGYHGMGISSNTFDYMFTNSDSLNVYRFDGKAGLALPFDFESNEFLGANNLFQGRGFAFDLGFTIIRRNASGYNNDGATKHSYTPYQYRFGISLLDVGLIRYNKNAKSMLFSNASGQIAGMDSLGFASINSIINEILLAFDNDENPVVQSGSFNIWLPSALSLQFDYSLGSDFYLNAFWIQNLALSQDQILRPSQISLIPRYESKLFEVAVPLALFRYQEPRIGIAFRIGYLTVGTDRLGALFGFNDFEGFDFYLSIKAGLCKKQYQKEYNRFERCNTFF